MFAVLNAAREQAQREEALFCASLVDIAAVASQPKEYGQTLRKYFLEQAKAHDEPARPRRPVVGYNEAAEHVAEVLRAKKRLERGE